MKRNIVLYLIVCLPVLASSQFKETRIDSLEHALILETHNEDKVNILLYLSGEFLSSNPEKAGKYAKDALQISDDIEFQKGKVLSLINIAQFCGTNNC